jgi:hypothetical protein
MNMPCAITNELLRANVKLKFTGGGFKPNSGAADADWRGRRIFAYSSA